MINVRWLAALGAALLLAGCATREAVPDTERTPTAPVAEEPVIEAEPDIDRSALRLTIAGVGDIMLGTDYPENHLPDDDGEGFLAAVAPQLRKADWTFGNLEGVLMDGGEPVKECSNPKACYLFRSPARYARHLAAAGFDLISLANNHARDFGEEGRDASMAALDAVGIRHSGREGTAASWTSGDIRLAFIAFSPTRESWNLLDIDRAAWAVTGLARRHDIVIVSFHGGAEGFDGAERLAFGMEYAYGEKRGNVVEFAHAVIDAGADLVFGHGPHVPRALELYNERLVAYSLGNFATYYGISVAEARGFAPVVVAEVDGDGRFIGGRIHSNIQVRPGGPQPDPQNRALDMMRRLTEADFPDSALHFGPDGTLTSKQ